MSPRPNKKRLGKKHRQASTRPKKGRAARSAPSTGAIIGSASPRKRKTLASKHAEQEKKRRIPTRSPERESHNPIAPKANAPSVRKPGAPTSAPGSLGREADGWDQDPQTPQKPRNRRPNIHPADRLLGQVAPDTPAAEAAAWQAAELHAAHMSLHGDSSNLEPRTSNLPLIAICGRPNVGKSTLFNRLTGSRRSIVGDEPGITRDRIYGLIDWASHTARLVDTGGVIPDDPDLIPAEIYRQAQAALHEADAIIMVTDGRTELASPDRDLARLLLRSGKPAFLAVNKIDTATLAPAAENFRQLGFTNVVPISAEHGSGIGDLLDDVFAALPEAPHVDAPEAFLTAEDEMDEDESGPDFEAPPGSDLATTPGAPSVPEADGWDQDHEAVATDNGERTTDNAPPTRLRSHAAYIPHETRVAIIGRPNVGKSTLLNALTGSDRAIVSPIAGTTRDAVDEVVTHDKQTYRFVDTAGIRRKGKTRLMAEKLSVVMARKHLEAADVSLLVLDATAGVTALDATIGGYAHESGRSIVIVVNKWDLLTRTTESGAPSQAEGLRWEEKTRVPHSYAKRTGGDEPPRADKKIYEQQIRSALKFLDYAPIVFLSASNRTGLDALYKQIALVARERRKRIPTGQMNRFLARLDFQSAPVPLSRRVKIYYMTQAAVAPPTFVLFTDRDVKLHFAFERFLANQLRAAFHFTGSPIWFKTRPRNKKKSGE